MNSWSKSDILRLSIPERIRLVGDIWDSIADEADKVPLSEAHREELDRRLEAYHANPAAGSTWPEVRSRILNRK